LAADCSASLEIRSIVRKKKQKGLISHGCYINYEIAI